MKTVKLTMAVVMLGAMVILGTPKAHALGFVFMNFEPPTFTPDATPGDHSHTFATPYGDITFNGRIWDELAGNPYPPSNPGSQYFLKNTNANAVITIDFSFDIFLALGRYSVNNSNFRIHGAAFDINGNLLDLDDELGDGQWHTGWLSGTGIRQIQIWTTRESNGNFAGNHGAVDNLLFLTNAPIITPEPGTMALMGLGLMSGLAGILRRRK